MANSFRLPAASGRELAAFGLFLGALGAFMMACGKAPLPPPVSLDTLAPAYVKLVLAIGEHDPNYVDAWYGPAEVRAKVKEEKLDLRNLAWHASDLIKALAKVPR